MKNKLFIICLLCQMGVGYSQTEWPADSINFTSNFYHEGSSVDGSYGYSEEGVFEYVSIFSHQEFLVIEYFDMSIAYDIMEDTGWKAHVIDGLFYRYLTIRNGVVKIFADDNGIFVIEIIPIDGTCVSYSQIF